jgi:hypothetical protein
LDFKGPFGAFVSAAQNRVSGRRRPALVETRFECWVSGWKAEHLALPRPFGRQVGEAVGCEHRNGTTVALLSM